MLKDSVPPLECPHQDTTVEVYLAENDYETSDTLEKTSIGDLYLLGKLWIEVLQTGLLGTKWRLPPLLPVVEAAGPPPPPQKPPKMKFKDLPLCTSPHYEYKDYLEDEPKKNCPGLKRKLMHEKVLPCVKSYRKGFMENYTDFVCEVSSMKKQAMCNFRTKKNEFICYMRSCENLQIRRGVFALGGVTGFLLGRKYKGRTSPCIIYTAIGLLAVGALCFPEDTDEAFRTLSLATGNFLIRTYNSYCNKRFALRGRLPCQVDLPPPPPPRIANKCPVK